MYVLWVYLSSKYVQGADHYAIEEANWNSTTIAQHEFMPKAIEISILI